MLIAVHNGYRKRAESAGSGALGTCPWTQEQVKAHVGLIRQYWAYVGGAPTMPPGYEPESEWHLTWKECIRDENCEVIFGDNSEHRADIVGDSDTVIEIQRSIIDIRESRERVRFYKENTGKRVVWVVDIQEIWRKTFKLSGKKDDKGNLIIDWKPKRTWLWDLAQTTDTNLFLEFNQKNDKLLQAWVHNKILKAKFVSKKDFFSRYMKSVAKPEYQENVDSAVDVLTGIA